MNNVLIIIPTYNEKKTISLILTNIFALELGVDVLVVDDNSPDCTSRIIKEMKVNYPGLHLITRNCKKGLGAYIKGFDYALENKYEVIVQMDADLSHSPLYIEKMITLLDKNDLVIGSRYVKEGEMSDEVVWRKLLSKGANAFVRKLLRLPIKDVTSGFKCMNKMVLEKIAYKTVRSNGYAFQIEMVHRAYLRGLKIYEQPITFRGRVAGESKMSLYIIREAFLKCISLCWNFKKRK